MMRDLEEVLKALAASRFRSRFRLATHDREYFVRRSRDVVRQHARRFIRERLAPAQPTSDGRQTPMRGHPVFVAQHATATCCRGCLTKWHGIPKGRELSQQEVDRILAVIDHWLDAQSTELPKAAQRRLPFLDTES